MSAIRIRPRLPALYLAGFTLAACFALWVFSPKTAVAVPASPVEITLEQPEGTSFRAHLFGDEWDNGFETANGYTIVENPENGVWEYAIKASGRLVPSGRAVGRETPPNVHRHLRSDVEAPPPGTASAPSQAAGNNIGTQRTLVILASFADQAPVATTAAQWNSSFFGISASVHDYYDEVSYGLLNIAPAQETHGTADDGVVGWVSLASNHPNTGQSTGAANQILTRDAILAANPSVNFASFDANANGFISTNELHLVVIVAGYEASYAGAGACGNDVWGHNWSLTSAQQPTVDGVVLGNFSQGGGYSQFGEMHCDHMATIGIMAHEIGHDLDWPDLYDVDLSSNGIGEWSVMSYGSWLALSGQEIGSTPPHPDAFSKSYQGWLSPTQIAGTQAGVAVAQAATSAQAIRLLDNPSGVDWNFNNNSGTGQYFLVENRQQVGYDASLRGCGLLIWHIDETRTSTNNANANESRKLVDLEEADGLASLDDATSRGDDGDPYPGSSNNTTFNASSNPNSNLYSGAASGVSVTNVSGCSASMTANFAAPGGTTTHQLSVTKSGTGTGTVTSSPAGINCGSTCQASFSSGQQVALTATPAAGSTFAGWSGACTGTATCMVTMDAPRSVTATFTTSSGGCPGTVSVNVTSFAFTPKAPVVQQGFCVLWNFNQGTHSVSETKLLGPGSTRLFDSGPKSAGTTFTFTFEAAGNYAYRSTVAGDPSTMTGTIKVPLATSANGGGVSTPITITWSHAAMSGFQFDVQYRYKVPGGTYSAWTNWRSNQTALSDVFTASSQNGAGVYQFRSRLENASTLKASAWSVAKTITIS